MSKHTITVTGTISFRHTINVNLPDGLTEKEVRARVDELVDALEPEDVDFDDMVIDDVSDPSPEYPHAPPPPPTPTPIPYDAWIEWDGHRWATDGRCAVREDCPPFILVALSNGWLTRDKPTPTDMTNALGDPDNLGPAPHVDARLEPLVRAAAAVRWKGMQPIHLIDGEGKLMALIMPTRDETCERLNVMFARTRETR